MNAILTIVACYLAAALAASGVAPADAAPRSRLAALVLAPAPGELGAVQPIVVFDGTAGADPRKIPGALGSEFVSVEQHSLGVIDRMLDIAARRGPGACDTLPGFPGRPQVWTVTAWRDAGRDSFTVLRATRATREAIRCGANRVLGNVASPNVSQEQFALITLAGLGGPPRPLDFWATWPLRDSIVRDAQRGQSTRDWSLVALELSTVSGPSGRGVRLSTAALPAAEDAPLAEQQVRVQAASLRRALLAFLPHRKFDIAAQRNPMDVTRLGVAARFGVVEWDARHTTANPVFEAYLTPIEMDSLARTVVAAIAPRDPVAARAVRLALGLTGPPMRATRRVKLPGPPTAAPPVMAVLLTPDGGREFVAPLLLLSKDGIWPDTEWRALDPPDRQPDFEWRRPPGFTQACSAQALAAVTEVLRRAAIDDSTHCDPLPQYPRWPSTWLASFVARDSNREVSVGGRAVVPTWRIRCRALEWLESADAPRDVNTRAALERLVTLGVREDARAGGAPRGELVQPCAPEDMRRHLLGELHRAPGSPAPRPLELDLWLDDGSGDAGLWASRITDNAGGPSPNNWRVGATVVSRATLAAVLADALGQPEVQHGSERTLRDLPSQAEGGEQYGEPYGARSPEPHGELRVLTSRRGSGAPELLYISFLDHAETQRVARRIADRLAPSRLDLALDLRFRALFFPDHAPRRGD